jgi:site-specific DNA-methyltransferase (adenine-specific)
VIKEIIGYSTLYNCDCKDLMAQYPDKHFDLAIVDPPFGLKRFSAKDGGNSRVMTSFPRKNCNWNIMKPDQNYFNELFRVSKYQIIWGGFNFTLPTSEYFIVWDKEKTVPNFARCELEWTNYPLPAKLFKYRWDGFLQENMKNKEVKIHPAQKPIALYKFLLANYAKPNDKILDTHFGSGSIAIACNELGFNLTASEIDQDYFNAACLRVREANKQGDLFREAV